MKSGIDANDHVQWKDIDNLFDLMYHPWNVLYSISADV